MLQCPFNKTLFLQILYRYTWISIIRSITINQYTHTFQQMHAIFKTEMQHTLFNKCNLPFEQCSVFLQGQYPYKIWSVSAKDMPCPLKEHNMHFHMPNLLLKGAISLFYTNIPAQDAILLTQDILLKSATYLKICDSLGMFFCSLQQRIVLYL